MARYIDVDKAYEIARTEHKDFAKSMADLTSLREVLEDTPTADLVEVRHSRWQCSNVRMSSRDITCGYCHRTEKISNGSEDFEYCPHCGTKMDDTPQKKVRGDG